MQMLLLYYYTIKILLIINALMSVMTNASLYASIED